jgi:hypothetical protein
VTQPGRQNPRLITHTKKSSGFELGGNDICHNLIVTRKYTSGEKHDKVALWEIVKVEPIQQLDLSESSAGLLQSSHKKDQSMYQSFVSNGGGGGEPKLYELQKGYTLVLER